MSKTWPWWIAVLVAVPAVAQDVQVALERPPYYIDDPVSLRIVASGFEEEPVPTVDVVSQPPEVRVDLVSVDPRVSSSVRIVSDPRTGRMQQTEQKSVVYVLNYEITTSTPGSYSIGPFDVKQQDESIRAQAVTLAFRDVALDPNMLIRLVLPDPPMYPDQRVPVSIEFGFAGDLEDINDLRIQSPLFDRFTFTPDRRPSRQSSVFRIHTQSGPIDLAAEARRETINSKPFMIFSAAPVSSCARPRRS